MLLVHAGEHTCEEIAEILGRARSTIQTWIRGFEKEGVRSLSHQQGQGRGEPTELRDEQIQRELRKGLPRGRWMTAVQVYKMACLIATDFSVRSRAYTQANQMIDVHLPAADERVLILPRYTHPEKDFQPLLHQVGLELSTQPPPQIEELKNKRGGDL